MISVPFSIFTHTLPLSLSLLSPPFPPSPSLNTSPTSVHFPNSNQLKISPTISQMACLQISRSGCFSPTVHLRSNAPLRRRPLHLAVRSRLNTENGDSNGDEPPESLFMKELKKRGVTPSSLLEDVGAEKEKDGGGVASAEYEKKVSAQRELSMALNSEGIEGLIPRAKVLLTLGGTFFLGFWPLILITISAFAAVYLYFGPSFVHDGSKNIHTPPYIDPYELLEDERIAQLAPNVK